MLFFLLIVAIAALVGLGVYGRRLHVELKAMRGQVEKLRYRLCDQQTQLSQMESEHQQQTSSHRTSKVRLRSYLELLDTLIHTIPYPIFFLNENGVLRGCNQAFSKNLIGLSRERMIDRPLIELDSEAARAVHRCIQRHAPQPQHPANRSFESKVVGATGKPREYLFNVAYVLGGEKKINGCVVLMMDLTERNECVRKDLENEKFQGALETAGAVCHELNQPLQIVLGSAELMQIEANRNASIQDLAQTIAAQVARMADITGKLQRLTRYETQSHEKQTAILDIHRSSTSIDPSKLH